VAPVYVLDACVLYPVVLRDLLPTLAALDAFEPRWSESIIDEMRRNVLADRPDIEPAQFDARSVSAMRRAFPAAAVEGYAHLIDAMDNHPKDRHVAAVAVHIGASAVGPTTFTTSTVGTPAERRRHRHPAASGRSTRRRRPKRGVLRSTSDGGAQDAAADVACGSRCGDCSSARLRSTRRFAT